MLASLMILAGWVQAKHSEGRRTLDRLLSDRGIPSKPAEDSWDAEQGALPASRFLHAAWVAHSLDALRLQVPPVLIGVAPGEAIPASELPWWVSGPHGKSNTWSELTLELERCQPQVDQILGLIEGRIPIESGRADFILGSRRDEFIEGLCHVLRAHALSGMRAGRVEPVVAVLRALEELGNSGLGWIHASRESAFQSEAESLRLAATLVRNPSEAWLKAIAPQARPGQQCRAIADEERVRFERQVSQLRSLPNCKLADPMSDIWVGSCSRYLCNLPVDIQNQVGVAHRGFVASVIFPVWRFGWGDLAIAEYVRDHERRMTWARSAMESRSWQIHAKAEWKAQAEEMQSSYQRLCHRAAFERKLFNEFQHRTDVGLNAVRIALLRYRLRHGEYPECLSQLVPEYLDEVPLDWMSGQPLRYRKQEGCGFQIRSCGTDCKDDGGRVRPGYLDTFRDVRGVRRAWVEEGNDLVWPTRASDLGKEKFMEAMARDHASRLKAKASGNPYGLSPELMRRYGLLPKSATPGTNASAVAGGASAQAVREDSTQ